MKSVVDERGAILLSTLGTAESGERLPLRSLVVLRPTATVVNGFRPFTLTLSVEHI